MIYTELFVKESGLFCNKPFDWTKNIIFIVTNYYIYMCINNHLWRIIHAWRMFGLLNGNINKYNRTSLISLYQFNTIEHQFNSIVSNKRFYRVNTHIYWISLFPALSELLCLYNLYNWLSVQLLSYIHFIRFSCRPSSYISFVFLLYSFQCCIFKWSWISYFFNHF